MFCLRNAILYPKLSRMKPGFREERIASGNSNSSKLPGEHIEPRHQSEIPAHDVPGSGPDIPSFENAASTHLDGSSSTAQRIRSCHQLEIWFRSARSYRCSTSS